MAARRRASSNYAFQLMARILDHIGLADLLRVLQLVLEAVMDAEAAVAAAAAVAADAGAQPHAAAVAADTGAQPR